MRRVGKGFSGVETPLFETMLAQVLDTCSALVLRVEGLENANDAQQLEIVKLKARVKKLEKINKGRNIVDMDQDEGIELVTDQEKDAEEKDAEVEGTHADKQEEIYNIDLDHSSKFWNTVVVKRSGDVTRLQALVDKKRIVITEEVVRVICLPNEEIFAGLARMGYEKPSTKLTFYKAFFSTKWKFFIHTILHSLSAKRTSWNEFSSAMASALIFLSSGQRFNLSKYIFESLVRNVDSSSMFYMVRKVFSGVETPLFETMLAVRDVAKDAEAHVPAQGDDVQELAAEEVATNVISPIPTSPSPSSPVIPSSPPHQSSCPPQPQDAEGLSLLFQRVLDTCSALVLRVEGLENANAAQQLEIVKLKARVKKLEKLNQIKSSKLRWLKKDEGIELVIDQEKDAEVEGRHAYKHAEIYNIDLNHSSKVLSMQEDDTEVQEAVEVVTTAKLITEVVTAAVTQVVAASTPIPAAKPKILKIVAAPAVSTRRRKEVVIRDPEEELHSDTPAKTPKVKDKGKGILIEDPKPLKKKDQIEMNAEYARKLQEEIDKEHEEAYKILIGMLLLIMFNPKSLTRFDANMKFLFKSREEMEKEDEEIIKSINETPAQKAAKRRKLSKEAQEANDPKKRLEIIQDEDDDVFVEATPLA
nr:hypothetical protein [Tanacetum cinerariifolium]